MSAERAAAYTPWIGEATHGNLRWWTIARGNLALAWSSNWVKAVLIVSLLPGIVVGGLVYFLLPLSPTLLSNTMQTETIFAFLIGALVGARLISEDRRQGAFMAHFSRPVRRLDYLVGKVVALLLPLLLVTSAGPLLVVGADALLSPDTVAQRLASVAGGIGGAREFFVSLTPLQALGGVAAFSALVSVGTTGLVLGLSALTTSARNAGVAWFAFVALGIAQQGILQRATHGAAWPALLSWSDTVGDVALVVSRRGGRTVEYGLAVRVALFWAVSLAGILFVDWRLRRAEGGERA